MEKWIWVRDVHNQYVFHSFYDNTTHQIEFDKTDSKSCRRKRKIMNILQEGYLECRYSVFNSDYLDCMFVETLELEYSEIKLLFGDYVHEILFKN